MTPPTDPEPPPDWLDLLPDAVFAFDAADRVVLWNRAAERTYGYTAAEALGQSVLVLVPHHALLPFARASEAVRRSGEWSGELLTQSITGTEVLVEARWAAGANGVVTCVHTDVGERRRVERQTVDARRWSAVRDLARAVAGELATPAAGTVGDVLRRFAAGPDPTEAGVYHGAGSWVVVAVERPVLRELIGATLAAAGYHAVVATDRTAAVDAVAGHNDRVRAAVLGYGADTLAVARALRRHHPLLAVVAVGPYARCEPADVWLRGPVGPGELLPAVAAAVAEVIAADVRCGG